MADTDWLGIGINAVGNYFSNKAKSDAIEGAQNAQVSAAQGGIDINNQRFAALQQGLAPYSSAGGLALTGMQNLSGLSGAPAQQSAISGIQAGPEFQALSQQGENAILQNASATGGLRGGNVQGALAQFRPQLLSQLLNQQYSRLGGLAGAGFNAASSIGNAGMLNAQQIAALQGEQGAAQAGGALAGGNQQSQFIGSIGQSFGGSGGGFSGASGGFGGVGGSTGFGGFGSSGSTMGGYSPGGTTESGIGSFGRSAATNSAGMIGGMFGGPLGAALGKAAAGWAVDSYNSGSGSAGSDRSYGGNSGGFGGGEGYGGDGGGYGGSSSDSGGFA